MRIAYIRISSNSQNIDRQEVLMKKLGVDKLYVEKASGKSVQGREQLKAMLDFVREGDVVVVESISRIARNTKDLLEITELLEKKGVKFVSQKESIDTDSPAGKFVLTVFGALSQLEREYILARQREGIEIAKKKGKYKGRKPIQVDEKLFAEIYSRWRQGECTAVEAMGRLGLKPATFYRRVKSFESRGADNTHE